MSNELPACKIINVISCRRMVEEESVLSDRINRMNIDREMAIKDLMQQVMTPLICCTVVDNSFSSLSHPVLSTCLSSCLILSPSLSVSLSPSLSVSLSPPLSVSLFSLPIVVTKEIVSDCLFVAGGVPEAGV
mgnify:CR=1 FL=1